MKYYAYARISRDPDLTSEAIDRQVADNTALAAKLGWPDVTHLIDRNRSAWKKGGSRPAFTELVHAIEAGECAGVIVWNLDRLLRRADQLEELINAVEQNPVPIHSANGDFDLADDSGRFVARIMVAVAQKESDDKSRRIRRALADKPPPSSHDCYGRTPAERRTLRMIVRRVLAGHPISVICTELEATGHPGPRGTRWWPGTVKKILASPKIIEHIGNESWVQLSVELDRRAGTLPPRNTANEPHQYTLTGLIWCERCEGTMSGKRSETGVARYCCNGSKNAKGCGLSIGPASTVEETVVRRISEDVRDSEMMPGDPTSCQSDVDHAGRLEELHDAFWLRREIPRATYDRLVSELTRAIELQTVTAKQSRLKVPIPLGEHFVKDYLNGSPIRRRHLLALTVGRVEVAPAVRGRKFDPTRLTIRTPDALD
jgi:site-specific DNA recombinase